MKANSVDHLTLGVEQAYFDGNSWECGDRIDLLNGYSLHQRCPVKSLASQVRPSRVLVSGPGRSLELELAIQILEYLLTIGITSFPLELQSG